MSDEKPVFFMSYEINLIKVFAIFLVAISHSIPYLLGNIGAQGHLGVINLDSNSGNTIQIFLTILRNWGQIGNLLFLISSAWLLVDRKEPRVRIEKIIRLMFDNAVIVWILLCVTMTVGKEFRGYTLQPGELRKFLFPTAFSTNWYVTTYIFLYAIHGVLNRVMESMNKRILLLVNSTLFFMYFVLVWWHGIFLYSGLIGFICIYLFIGYYKKYIREDNEPHSQHLRCRNNWWKYLFVGIGIHITSIMIIFYAGIKFEKLSNDMLRLNIITNPVFLLIAMSLFLLVVERKESENNTHNNLVNSIAQLSLYIYLIHGSTFVVRFIKTDYYDYVYRHFGYDKLWIWIAVYVVITFLAAVIISYLYNISIGVGIKNLSYTISRRIEKWIDK